MFKKHFSKVLVFLLCCSISITAFALAEQPFAENSEAPGDNDNRLIAKEDGVFIYNADNKYVDYIYGAPDEVLSAPTTELLEYFLNTDYMRMEACAPILSATTTYVRKDLDFTGHEAFRELITRDDFVKTLETYAGSVLYSSKSKEIDNAALELLLAEPHVKALVSDLKHYPNLRRISGASEAVPAASALLYYYSAGTVSTASGNAVEVFVPSRELTPSEIEDAKNDFANMGNTLLLNPTAVFNCHSYAWYRQSATNPYWINDITPFVNDSACTAINDTSNLQKGDTVVYLDQYGYPVHSGVIDSVSSSGKLTVCSKWGLAGLYRHPAENVPPAYRSDPDGKFVSLRFYRYHDYEQQYTGNEYHSGSFHYFQCADVCKVCKSRGLTTWTSIPCNGPPCPTFLTTMFK